MRAKFWDRRLLGTAFEGRSGLLLLLLLAGDLIFFVLQLIRIGTSLLSSARFNLSTDRGYPELFQYLKFLAVIVAFAFLARRFKSWAFLAWSAVFGYFLLDDALQLHERGGVSWAKNDGFAFPLGITAQDTGELLVSGVAGVLLLALLAVAVLRGGQRFRRVSTDTFLLILVLVFFGVFFDMIHSAVGANEAVRRIFTFIEDGGEMVAVSLLAWHTHWISTRHDDEDGYLHQLVGGDGVLSGRRERVAAKA